MAGEIFDRRGRGQVDRATREPDENLPWPGAILVWPPVWCQRLRARRAGACESV